MNKTNAFKKYSEEKPPSAGLYIWRVPHKHLSNAVITFIAKYRERGAGSKTVLSPEFDFWDGYRLNIPKNTEWADYAGDEPRANRDTLSVNDLKIAHCPFCKQIPDLAYRGRFITAGPLDSEYWYFECCGWIRSPRLENPVKLIGLWNDKVGALPVEGE